MARIPMVTRTIVTTTAEVMCLDVSTGTPVTQEVSVPRTYKNDADLLKKVQSVIDTDTFKAVHIKSSKEVETLYGMTEDEFIQYAKVLPPRNVQTGTTEAPVETSEC